MKKSFKPSLFATPLVTLALSSTLMSGCASGPSGAPNGFVPNRLSVTMQLQQPVNNAYLYSFAFDDDDDASDGPLAIVSSTTLPNGVVAGAFTVLVQYEGGQYTAYRRTVTGGGTSETLDRCTQAFATQPSPASGNTLNFVLNLDAVTDSGVRLFGATTQRLDVNFVTANERRRDPADNTRKAFDAFGPGSASSYATLDIRSNRTYTNSSSSIGEPANDVQTDDTTGSINLAQLDITDFSITVERS